MDTNSLVYMGMGVGGGCLAGALSGAPWMVLTLGVLGLGTAYFIESGGTGLPYPDINPDSGGGGDASAETAGASGDDYNTVLQNAIAYAQHYGYKITDLSGMLDGIRMECNPIGAVALHATLGMCAWKYCDIIGVAAGRLGQSESWVMDFRDGFHHSTMYDANPTSDGYLAGLNYRQQYMPGAV